SHLLYIREISTNVKHLRQMNDFRPFHTAKVGKKMQNSKCGMQNTEYRIQNTKYKIQDGARGPLTAFAELFLRAGALLGALTAFAERVLRGWFLRIIWGFRKFLLTLCH
ncbi:MAG: hypothetical protein K2G15_03935, partial [Muribaculaceae bacterium]|nr:hypothetical protein [Muribaculaceae bacterium]